MGKALLLATLLLAARPARAQTEMLPAGPWYGWQLMLADTAAITMLTVPLSSSAGPVGRGTGMIALFMNGPVVHMAHRNPRSASVSLMRLPALWLGGLLGRMAGSFLCTTVECVDRAQLLGAGIGLTPVLLHDWLSARRPARSIYLVERPRLPPPRLEWWAATLPVVAGRF